MDKALIIIDLQNDFMPWGALPIHDGEKIIKSINSLMEKFEHVYATQDWHPQDHVSFALNHGLKPGETIQIGKIKQILWPEHCVQESLGAELVSPLHQEKIEKIFRCGEDPKVDSYSIFFNCAGEVASDLDNYLKKKGIKKLYFVGVATDYCVKLSVLDALRLGYDAFLIRDACKAVNRNPGDEENAIKEMEKKGASIISTNNIL